MPSSAIILRGSMSPNELPIRRSLSDSELIVQPRIAVIMNVITETPSLAKDDSACAQAIQNQRAGAGHLVQRDPIVRRVELLAEDPRVVAIAGVPEHQIDRPAGARLRGERAGRRGDD